jgi:DNA-binding MarR family transcriptional regulator
MVAMIDELERKGLVERRTQTEDRRKNAVELTAAGRTTLRAAVRASAAAEKQFLSRLSDEEARQFRESLATLIGRVT